MEEMHKARYERWVYMELFHALSSHTTSYMFTNPEALQILLLYIFMKVTLHRHD